MITRLIQALKARRNSGNAVVRLSIATLDAANRILGSGQRFLFDGQHRSILLLRWRNAQDLHQTSITTGMDRYPALFSACREYFASNNQLNILSFGCSTGEEVLTLRRYFPHAAITGADINRRNVAICRRHRVDDKIRFLHSSARRVARHGPFDAIFCMAVLQRTPSKVISEGITTLAYDYPFEKFERQVAEFDAWLRVGGLLVIHHTHYIFTHTATATRYRPVEGSAGPILDTGIKFDRESKRIDDPPTVFSIYCKVSA